MHPITGTSCGLPDMEQQTTDGFAMKIMSRRSLAGKVVIPGEQSLGEDRVSCYLKAKQTSETYRLISV